MKAIFSSGSTKDTEAWEKLIFGDQQGLEYLYKTYYRTLTAYASKLTGDEETALNCLHDLFCHIWDHRDRLGKVQSVKAYLIVALRRQVFQHIRSTQKAGKSDFIFFNEQSDIQFSAEDILIQNPHLKESYVAQLLNSLPARQREVIYLRYFEDMSLEDIAEALSIQYQSVSNLLQRSYQAIRQSPLAEKVIEMMTIGIGVSLLMPYA
jgi:RNA polymerase sigma factor (sigma-70 family)